MNFLIINVCGRGIFMAEPAGLEPVTSSVTGKRSNQLSYGSTHFGILHYFEVKIKLKFCIKGINIKNYGA